MRRSDCCDAKIEVISPGYEVCRGCRGTILFKPKEPLKAESALKIDKPDVPGLFKKPPVPMVKKRRRVAKKAKAEPFSERIHPTRYQQISRGGALTKHLVPPPPKSEF